MNSAKIGVDVIAAEDLANNAITTAEITDGAIKRKNKPGRILGSGYYIGKDGTVNGNASDKDNLFRVNLNATTGNVTLGSNNNASASH